MHYITKLVYFTLITSPCLSLKASYALVRDSLASYRSIHGNVKVPYNFVVPNHDNTDVWPMEARGMQLGKVLSRIRCRGDYMQVDDQRRELLDLGVQVKKKRDREFEMIIEALEVYKRAYDHLDVENCFKVPHDDTGTWPIHLRGYNLGARVHSIRYQNAYSDKDQVARLKKIGFAHKVRRKRVGGPTVLNALRCYKAKFGHLNVPVKYKVPDYDDDFPEGIRGMALGVTVAKIRGRGDYKDYRDQLDALGFEWVVWRDKEFRNILQQLAFAEIEALDDEGLGLLEGLMSLNEGNPALSEANNGRE